MVLCCFFCNEIENFMGDNASFWMFFCQAYCYESILATELCVSEVRKEDFTHVEYNRIPLVSVNKDKYEYIDSRQNSTCCLCENSPIEHYHHLILLPEDGFDLPENLIGVCKKCHEKIHNGKLKTKIEYIKKKCKNLSVLNQALPYIIKEIEKKWPSYNLIKVNLRLCRRTRKV